MTFNFNDAIDKRLKKQKLVEETLSELLGLKVLKEAVARKTDPISLKTISTIRPEDKTELEIFLKNIQGNNLRTKVTNINAFFSRFMKEGFSAEDPTLFENKTNSQALQETISYLVFYKTLTTMIASLDASSAGFSFESFLSVLIGGSQKPASQANTEGTLVDVVGTNEGDISAKLLAGSPSVTGAYFNLISDMKAGREIKYIVGIKEFSGKDKKEGKLSFGEFIITRDNFIDILMNAGTVTGLEGIRVRLSPELEIGQALEIEEVMANFQQSLVSILKVSDNLNDEERKLISIATTQLVFSKEENLINRDTFVINKKLFSDLIQNFDEYFEYILQDLEDQHPEYRTIAFVDQQGRYTENYEILFNFVKQLPKFISNIVKSREKTTKVNTVNPQQSAELYKKAKDDQERNTILDKMLGSTKGVGGSFTLSYSRLKSLGFVKEYPETIDFGQSKLEALVSNLSNVTKVTGLRIIEDAQGMLEDLNKYFAGGLENSELADSARTKARRIDRKTKEISTKES